MILNWDYSAMLARLVLSELDTPDHFRIQPKIRRVTYNVIHFGQLTERGRRWWRPFRVLLKYYLAGLKFVPDPRIACEAIQKMADLSLFILVSVRHICMMLLSNQILDASERLHRFFEWSENSVCSDLTVVEPAWCCLNNIVSKSWVDLHGPTACTLSWGWLNTLQRHLMVFSA